ncbi:hypothetical protein [Pseudomonas purpurea]|uniref:hypothetical protein n=1 Tax=Pseudomonas purpurea TaxID=3136737 RepID=UPI003264F710
MTALVAVLAFLAWTTPVVSNALMLLMDRVNFIPAESSIWTFEPYEINQGSSSWWVYGKDAQHYYYFSYEPDAPYLAFAKTTECAGFDSRDFRTWCTR